MPRYAIQIEYNGTPFSGWQRQIDRPSVQGTIEAALTKVDPACPKITGAGRTDAGVHATGQVAHVDLDREWDPFRLMEAVNFHLKPNPIAIVACEPVAEEWHARFSASERRYMFRMVARRAPLVQDAGWVWQVKQEMDVEAMRAGAAMLVGDHDFSTFRASHCQARSPFKTMDRCDIEVVPLPFGTEFRFHVWARSFLHNQVRSIVGTLERVGAGSWTPQDVRTALEARDRTACGPVSPPEGLYLVKVAYADDPFLGNAQVDAP